MKTVFEISTRRGVYQVRVNRNDHFRVYRDDALFTPALFFSLIEAVGYIITAEKITKVTNIE